MKKLLVILILILVNQLSNESFQKSINERSGSIDTIVESSEIENELIANGNEFGDKSIESTDKDNELIDNEVDHNGIGIGSFVYPLLALGTIALICFKVIDHDERAAETRRCPVCDMPVSRYATRCPHCRSEIGAFAPHAGFYILLYILGGIFVLKLIKDFFSLF